MVALKDNIAIVIIANANTVSAPPVMENVTSEDKVLKSPNVGK